MGERRIRQTSEIDDIGALGAQDFRTNEEGLEANLRRINDLSENAQCMARQIQSRSGLTEKHR